MTEKIQALKEQIEAMTAANAAELEALRIKYLSKKGEITALFSDFRNVPNEQKREIGQKLNELKTLATDKINALKQAFEDSAMENVDIDLTRTAAPQEIGTRHPISLVRKEIIDIFSRLGFTIAEGPEVEDDWHVFSSLNFADDHPARDMQDTFFIQRSPDVLLRTHTSSVQSRVMEHAQPPIRIICPGRVYRNEAISARAHCFFHQVEALYVAKNVTFADLKQHKRCSDPKQRFVCARRTSHSPSHRQKWTSLATSAAERAVHSAKAPDGWKYLAAAWLTPTCSKPAASTARYTPASPSVWASNVSPT